MKLKKLLKLVSRDTKIKVIFDFDVLMYDPILIEPSDYPIYRLILYALIRTLALYMSILTQLVFITTLKQINTKRQQLMEI